MTRLRVLAVGSDSVGHLSHAAVLLSALARHREIDASVVVPADARFRGWIERRGFTVHGVGTVMGLHQELSVAEMVRYAGRITRATVLGMRGAGALLDRLRPDLVLGCGGRSSFAPMLAAALRGYPTLTVPHYALRRANRALAWLVDRTCLAREEDVACFPRILHPRLRVTRTPLRPEAFAPASKSDARMRLGLDADRPVVAFVGYSHGSPGTTALFAAAAARIRHALPGAQLVVQYGAHPPARDDATVLEETLARPFFDDLLSVFPACDLVVSAAGETTLLEACARGVPSVCVSVPDSPIGPHIRTLAGDLARAGGTEMVDPTPDAVAGAVLRLLADPAERGRMGDAARGMADPRAVDAVLDVMDEVLAARRPSRAPRPEMAAA